MNPFWIGVFAAGVGLATVAAVFIVVIMIEAVDFVRQCKWTRNRELHSSCGSSSTSV